MADRKETVEQGVREAIGVRKTSPKFGPRSNPRDLHPGCEGGTK